MDVLAGVPFMDTNDISIRPAKQELKLGDGTIYHYGIVQQSGPRIVRQALILRSPVTTTLWPGDFIELDVPSDIALANPVALEPRITTYINNQLPTSRIWPPNILTSIGGKVRIPNDTTYPIKLRKHDQFCHIHQVSTQVESISTSIYNSGEPQQQVQSALPFSRSIILDTDDLLPPKVRSEFVSTNTTYDRVFRPFDSGYNGAVGPIWVQLNLHNGKTEFLGITEPNSLTSKINLIPWNNKVCLENQKKLA